MKQYNLPINDERIQTITEEQIDLILWSSMLDNKEAMVRSNYFHDPDFEEEWEALAPNKEDENSPVRPKSDDWEEVE